MRRLLPLALLLLLALPAAAQAADLPLRPKGDRSALGNERLSNERTITRWAHTNLRGGIRAKPSWKSKAIGALRWNTEDGLPEVYLALASHVDHAGGQVWIKIRIPGRPNGRTGWVRQEQLSNLELVETQLTIDRRRLRATLRKRGKVIWRSPVGVGAPGTGTPGGKFWIRERLPEPRRQPDLRPVGVRHRRLLEAVRLARRRRRRDPRHEPARADPGPAVARLHPRPEPEDQQARADHADRDAGADQVAAATPANVNSGH